MASTITSSFVTDSKTNLHSCDKLFSFQTMMRQNSSRIIRDFEGKNLSKSKARKSSYDIVSRDNSLCSTTDSDKSKTNSTVETSLETDNSPHLNFLNAGLLQSSSKADLPRSNFSLVVTISPKIFNLRRIKRE